MKRKMNKHTFLPDYPEHKSLHHVQSIPCEPDRNKEQYEFPQYSSSNSTQFNHTLIPTISIAG
jgi:hypothetical protein